VVSNPPKVELERPFVPERIVLSMSRSARAARDVALTVTSVLAVLALGFLALFLFALLTTFLPFGSAYIWANVGVVVAILVAVATLVVATEVGGRRLGKRVRRTASLTTVAGLVVIGIILTQSPTPVVVPFTELFVPRAPHDVLVLMDPNDPWNRDRVDVARSNPKSLAPVAVNGWGTDVAFGIAVLRPPGSASPWSLVLEPTTDYARVVAALASVRPNAGGSAIRSLGPALREIAAPDLNRARWRSATPHTVVLATGELPDKAELLGPGDSSSETWERTLQLLGRSALPRFPRSTFSVLWDPETNPKETTTELWRSWTRHANGNAAEPQDVGTFFDDAAYASLNRFFTQDFELAMRFRPHLRFDSRERFRPLDVDSFLKEEQPELCTPVQLHQDECTEPSLSNLHLAENSGGYLQLGGDERTGRDLQSDDPGSLKRLGSFGKIYYKITRREGRAYIEYWWFFRFNESPAYADYMCLAGLSIASGSCFDHQGDWEGITVSVIDTDRGNRDAFVTYTGHNWPGGYRYHWKDLQKWGSVADGTHPVVYVARGSHASYPVECPSDCTQLDFRVEIGPREVKIPDGDHDGAKEWPPNAVTGNAFCGCLQPLPLTFDGRPVGWLAFRGQWGSAACTYVLKACTRTLGPHSPAYQARYGKPFESSWGDLKNIRLTSDR
jgi:hypothetical protein